MIVVLSMWNEVRAKLLKLGVPVYTALNGYNSVDEMMELLRDCGYVLGLRPQADELETHFAAPVPMGSSPSSRVSTRRSTPCVCLTRPTSGSRPTLCST